MKMIRILFFFFWLCVIHLLNSLLKFSLRRLLEMVSILGILSQESLSMIVKRMRIRWMNLRTSLITILTCIGNLLSQTAEVLFLLTYVKSVVLVLYLHDFKKILIR